MYVLQTRNWAQMYKFSFFSLVGETLFDFLGILGDHLYAVLCSDMYMH